MKLFRWHDHLEGEPTPQDAIITMGKCYDFNMEITDGWKHTASWRRNGFFIMFKSPVVTKDVTQMCPHEFVMKTQDCRKTYRSMWRRIKGEGKMYRSGSTHLTPI